MYNISVKRKGVNEMTKAEKKAYTARVNDLMKQGIDKEMAKVMAKVELETRLIKPVVNF